MIIKKQEDEQQQTFETLAKEMKVGDRCQLHKHPLKPRGVIQYIGTVPSLGKFILIGIELDEPHGKYNGSVKEKKYFECKEKYGDFLRPDEIQVGDYPVVDEFANLSDEEL